MEIGLFGDIIESDKYLYHFTSLESGIEYILDSERIRFSPLQMTNDPKESVPSFFITGDSSQNTKKILNEFFDMFHKHSKVLCFCSDLSKTIKEQQNNKIKYMGRGFNHPRMWAQYAQNHRGLCLVFEKNHLINEFNSTFNANIKYSDTVKYDELVYREKGTDAPFLVHLDQLLEKGARKYALELMKQYKEYYFFRKTKDWKDENEFRFVVIDEDNDYLFLNTKRSLRAIILGFSFPNIYMPTILSLKKKYPAVQISKIKWSHGTPQKLEEILDC